MSNNDSIAELVKIYLSISSINLDQHNALANQSLETQLRVFTQILSTPNEPIVLPYKDISDIIFQNDYRIDSNSLESFCEKVDLLITEFKEKPRCKAKGQRLMACHKKLVGHIMLAQAQKEFMQKSVKQAQDIAEAAKQAAQTARQEADKANDTYKSMFANYVTILGVFTAVIVTIFGGLNVINVVMRQDSTNFSHVVSLAAVSLMCVVLLLYFLANMIIKITQNSKNYWLGCLSLGIVLICGFAIFHFGGMNKQPDNNESIQKNINQKKIQTTINSKQ